MSAFIFHENATYDHDDEDEVYLYGQMEFNNEQNWLVPHRDVILESKITSGRFADIFKARWASKHKGPEDVVAKVLKSICTMSFI